MDPVPWEGDGEDEASEDNEGPSGGLPTPTPDPEVIEWTQAYLMQFGQLVYGMHVRTVEELCAAFMARYRVDPGEAEVVTHWDEEKMTYKTHVRRRTHGRDR